MHAFVPVADQAGTLAGTYNATSQHDRRFPWAWREATIDPTDARIAARGRPKEVEFDRRFVDAAFRFIRRHPLSVLEAGGHNLLRLLHLDGFSYGVASINGETGIGSGVAKASIVSFWVFLALAVAGAFTAAARRVPLAMWLVPIVLATPVFILSGTRLRAPVDPFIATLAGFAIIAAIRRSPWSGYLDAWSTR